MSIINGKDNDLAATIWQEYSHQTASIPVFEDKISLPDL